MAFVLFSCEYILTYPDWAYVQHFLWVGLSTILSVSLQALPFEVRSFDNFKDFKSQLTHCCHAFQGRPCSRLPAILYCEHFFIQLSLRQTWSNSVNSLFVVLHPRTLSMVYLINYQMIFYPLSLHIQSILPRLFC